MSLQCGHWHFYVARHDAWLICTCKVASFPGLPTVQFLISCSMQKLTGKTWPFYHMNDVSIYLGRQRRGGVPGRKNAFHECILRFEPTVVHLSLSEPSKLQYYGQKLKEKPQVRSFDPPLLIYRGGGGCVLTVGYSCMFTAKTCSFYVRSNVHS